jgi:ABC-type transport system involved in multi-copper enzyme maturation permease subunit
MSNDGRPRGNRWLGPVSVRQSGEWLGLSAVLIAALLLARFQGDLLLWQKVAAWSGLGIVLALLLRRGWIRLFGPVLFYDLVRNARRTRTFVTRCAYLLLLLLFLWSVVGSQLEQQSRLRNINGGGVEQSELQKSMAALAEAFFVTFMGVQFALALFLTPAYVASGIAEEKERKTLEFLLATDLDSREIVLGKLASRVGYLTLLLLTGLPVLSAVQFLGGVAPELVLAGFAATALTVAGLSGLSILTSVYTRRSRDAIMLTYLGMAVYCGLCVLGTALEAADCVSKVALFPGGPSPENLVGAFQAGNPGYAIYNLFSGKSGPPQTAVTGILTSYAIFHVLLTVVTIGLAVVRLRPVALREAGGGKKAKAERSRAARAIGERPMVWKELHHDAGVRFRRWGLVMIGLLAALSFAPVPFIWATSSTRYGYGYNRLEDEMNMYVRVVGTIVACVAMLGAAVRGSIAVRIERDKDTLDALLTSPLSTREILFAKWLGCLWGLRWSGVWLGTIYLLGMVTGGLSLFAVPPLVAVVLIYSGSLALVGLWFSVVCRTTVRATVATVFASLGLGFGHWLIWLCCVPLLAAGPGGGEGLKQVAEFQAGITPPFVLAGVLPFRSNDYPFGRDGIESEFKAFALIGTIAWIVFGAILWAVLNDRFQTDCNRADVLVPEGQPAKPSLPQPESQGAA